MAQENPEDIFIGQVAQKALIEREGKVLISLDIHVDNWDLPGGRMHKGENPKEALAREVFEEIGVEVEVGEPFFTGFAKADRFVVVYKAVLKNPEQSFTLAPDEIKEVCWVGKDEYGQYPYWDVYKKTLDAYFAR